MSGERNAIIIAVGKKGSGKTYRIRQLARPCRRALILDPEAKWKLAPGDVEVWGGRHLVHVIGPGAAGGLCNPSRRFRIVYRDRDLELMKLAGPGAAFALRNVTVVLDELAWFCTPRHFPERLRWLIQFGRERQINVLGTAREPHEIHNTILSAADWLLLFRVDPGNGLDLLRRRYGSLVENLSDLPKRKFRTYGNPKIAQLLGREGVDGPP